MPTETNSESEHPIQVLNDGQHSFDQATFLTSGGAMLLRPTVKVTNNVMVPQPTPAVNTPSSSTGLSRVNAQPRSQSSANTGMWDTFRQFLRPTSNPGHSGRIVCSEGFITVSSAQDLEEEKQEPTKPEVYIRSMLTSGMGLASWEPSPYDGERGTEPGDVGTFTAAGGFRKILNLWDDAEDIRRHGAALPEICGYTPPDKKMSTRKGALLPRNPIRDGTTAATRYTDDGSISSFEFNMTAPKGAVLVSTSRADLEELVNYIKLRDFIIGNAGLLYQYVNMVRGLGQDESLYIVTGCIKSESWAMAAFTEPTAPPHDVLRLVKGRGSDPTPPYVWTSQGTALVKSFHPEEHTDDANVIVNRKDQTLFMHGFKLSFSSEFRSRWSSPSTPRGSSEPRSDSDFSDEGGRRDGQDDTHRGSSRKRKRGDGADGSGIGPGSSIGHALSSGVSLQTFPERHTEIILHPLDVTNRQLLDLTNADFALTHDDDWRFTLQGMTLDDVDSFNAFRTSSISVSNGVAFLVNGEPQMQDLGGALDATQISTFDVEDLHQNSRELDPRRLDSPPKHPDMRKAWVEYLPDSRKPEVDHIYKRESSSTDIGTHNTPVDDLPSPISLASEQKRTAKMSTALLPSQTNLSHHPLYLNQGPDHLEQGDIGRTYGPISHSSLQSSSSMYFRTEHRAIKHRPAPYSVMYRQQGSQVRYHQQGSQAIYNGCISAGVNFSMSGGDSGILQYLKEHAATGAMHDSDERFPPPLCHPGTREAVIYRVLDWYGYQKRPGKPIMWVYAPAGYGKTAVAGTVAGKLEGKLIELDFNPLGATFFFCRTSPDRNSPARFIITLTYQLFASVPELAPHIENAIKRDPMILSMALEVQLMKLIIGPFKALGDTKDMPNRLIIIDGLDECINSGQESRVEKQYAEDQERVQIRVLDLIHTLASHQFPLSFLILSRPEAWIKQHMESRKFKDLVEFVDLYEVGDNMSDVEKFVREELSRLGVDDKNLVNRLVERAGGYMGYASTVIRHIDDPYCYPRNCLQSLLTNSSSSHQDLAHSTPFSSLHELYRQILQSCPEKNSKTMTEVLGELHCRLDFRPGHSLDEAVTILDGLSGRDPGSGTRALRGLRSVIHLDNAEVGIRPEDLFVHSSFTEFLNNPHLSLEFTIRPGKAGERLVSGCLDCMSSTLYRKVPDEPRVRYAVVHWSWLWWDWCSQLMPAIGDSHQPWAIPPEWSEMCQRLLSIDLMACFVLAFTPGSEVTVKPYFPPGIAKNGPEHFLITYLGDDIYHSEPLAQPAVLHVASSFKAAILHLLKPAHLDSCGWSETFADAVCCYLDEVVEIWRTEPDDDWNDDAVVLALKTLLRESPVDFVSLRQRVVQWSEEQDCLPREGLDRFFDYVCSDNV